MVWWLFGANMAGLRNKKAIKFILQAFILSQKHRLDVKKVVWCGLYVVWGGLEVVWGVLGWFGVFPRTDIDACQLLGFLTVTRVNDWKKTAAKMSKQSDLRFFFAKEMQTRTKNHPLAAVQSQICPNLLKTSPQKRSKIPI